jgi:hypothetical protein
MLPKIQARPFVLPSCKPHVAARGVQLLYSTLPVTVVAAPPRLRGHRQVASLTRNHEGNNDGKGKKAPRTLEAGGVRLHVPTFYRKKAGAL